MSMNDPISDMINRINNARKMNKPSVSMSHSKVKAAIAATLKHEGYIEDFYQETIDNKLNLVIVLKYYEGKSVIETLKRVSTPGCRQYRPVSDLPKVVDGYGISIISTSKGIMSDIQARKLNVGGEIICYVF